MNIAAAAATVAPLWQAQHQHEEAFVLNNTLHHQAIELADLHHRQETKFSKILHKRSCALERELHYRQMSHDLDIARREAIRDVWSQRNQMTQTLMVVDTLMFACAFAITVQGDPPETTPLWLVRLYAVSLSSSLSFLFASIWFSLKVQTRMAHYDMHRPHLVYSCGTTHLHFNEYYECHCQSLSRYAFVAFYVGTAATIADAAIFAVTKLMWEYNNNVAGTVLFLLIASVAMVMPLVGKKLWPSLESGDLGGLAMEANELREKNAEAADQVAQDRARFERDAADDAGDVN